MTWRHLTFTDRHPSHIGSVRDHIIENQEEMYTESRREGNRKSTRAAPPAITCPNRQTAAGAVSTRPKSPPDVEDSLEYAHQREYGGRPAPSPHNCL